MISQFNGDTRIIDLTVEQFQQLMAETFKNNVVTQNFYQQEEQDLVPIEVAMQITNLARATIYGLVCHRKIPFIKKNKRLYFSRRKLIEWIQEKD